MTRGMGAEHFLQICATSDNPLCGGWLFVVGWSFPTYCRDAVRFREAPLQVSTSSRWKVDYTLMTKNTYTKGRIPEPESAICEGESIDQLNAQRIESENVRRILWMILEGIVAPISLRCRRSRAQTSVSRQRLVGRITGRTTAEWRAGLLLLLWVSSPFCCRGSQRV